MRRKNMSAGRVRAFKRVIHDLLFVCGSSEELVCPENFKEFHICQNLNSIDQVEVLYYRAGITSCCSHCDTKRASKLSCGTNENPICSDCVKKKKQTMCRRPSFAKKEILQGKRKQIS